MSKKDNSKNKKNIKATNTSKNVVNKSVNKSKVSTNRVSEKKEELSLTKQQYFNFETNNIEFDDKQNNKKKSSKKQKVVVVEKKVYPKFLLFILIFLNLCLISSGLYHFMTFDHNKVKIVTKKVIIKENIDDNYLFLGDSITNRYDLNKYYEDLPVVNSGIGGNITNNILDDMNNRIYKYNPTKVFLLIGTNDISIDRTNEEIVNNIEKIIKGIKKNRPNCKIYLESIYPINKSDNEKINLDIVDSRTNETIKEINFKLKELSRKLNITYIDMYNELVDEDDNLKLEYTKEGLHLTDKGYEKVTEILMKYINN